MFFTKKVLRLILSIPVFVHSDGNQMDECLSAVNSQSANEDYLTTSSVDSNTLIITRDYTRAVTIGKNLPFKLLKDECDSISFDICGVNTIVQYKNSSVIVQEISKPVCFPKTCDETTVVDILDPDPLFCTTNQGCQIIERQINCPSEREDHNIYNENNGSDNCPEDIVKVLLDPTIIQKTNVLERKLDNECRERLYHGTDNDWCRLHGIDNNKNAVFTTDIMETIERMSINTYHVVKDFSSLKGQAYKQLKQTCEGLEYTLCTVDLQARIDDVVSVYELSKPICFPSTCNENFVLILDPEPICDDFLGCDIVATNVQCPARNPESFKTDCIEDAQNLLIHDHISSFSASLLNKVEKQCDSIMYGQNGEECNMITPLVTNVSFSAKDIAFKDLETFESTCQLLGKQACYVSGYTAVNTKEIRHITNRKTQYVDIPVCIPNECANDQMKIDAMNKSLFKCDIKNDCVLSEIEFDCPLISPTTPTPSFLNVETASTDSFSNSQGTTLDNTNHTILSGIPSIDIDENEMDLIFAVGPQKSSSEYKIKHDFFSVFFLVMTCTFVPIL